MPEEKGGIELIAICHMCKTAVCVEDLHVKWVSKAEFLRRLREANWTVGELVLCPECNGQGEPE